VHCRKINNTLNINIKATLTNEQIEQKLQQLKQLTEEVNALSKELVEAGAIELSDEDLDKATGGNAEDDIRKKQESVERYAVLFFLPIYATKYVFAP